MNYRLLFRLLGILTVCEAVLMLPSLFVAAYYGQGDVNAFLITIAITLVVGVPLALFMKPKSSDIFAREGFTFVALGWIFLSLFGCLPFFLGGYIPNFIDAWFETVSGFTTTGASILKNVEALPNGMLFWRSFTHWVGGMGVLVLTLALIPRLGSKTMNILRAESPGPAPGKLLPKTREFAKVLYLIYLAMTVLLIVLLIIFKMPVFDAFAHAFGTAGTGGFSIKNASIGYYKSPQIDFIIGLFMLLFGVNFSVYFALAFRNFKTALKNSELYTYIIIVLISIGIIMIQILPTHKNLLDAFRYAGFAVSSIITTTGYANQDFNLWPEASKFVLLLLMIIGACAGSTGGGVKVVRLQLLGKTVVNEIRYILHPRSVAHVKLDGRIVDKETLHSVLVFFFIYISIMLISTLVISFDNLGIETSLSSVVSCLGNIGPGLGLVGPTGNYSMISQHGKVVLSMCMLLGRLEILPILILFTPSQWRKA